MPVTSNAISVGTSPVKISNAKTVTSVANQFYDPNVQSKYVFVQDGGYDTQTEVYIGGSEVTTATGIKMSKVNVQAFQLHSDDELYAIASDTDGEIRVTEVA